MNEETDRRGAAGESLPGADPARGATSSPRRVLIRGGYVITMDPNLGDLPKADVLIQDGVIAAIAPSLSDSDATVIDAAVIDATVIDATGHVVMPGMIDTHRHLWQTQLRALCADWTIGDYFFAMRLNISPAYLAEDVYTGNYLGALDALNSGVTTVLDFSHCNNTPDHSDASVTGLRDAGIRAVYGYGFFNSSPRNPDSPTFCQRAADFARIGDTYFTSDSGLLTLGVALTEVGTVPLGASKAEVRAARERHALITAHTGGPKGFPRGLVEMDAQGMLGPDQVHVHCTSLSNAEWDILARNGAKFATTVETEMAMGMGTPQFDQCARTGLKPTLGCDICSLNSGDLFTQVRFATAFHRWSAAEQIREAGARVETLSITAHDALAWVTTNSAEALGLGGRVGSLTPGRQGDVIVVGGNSFSQRPRHNAAGTIVFQTTTADVRAVLVAGRIVKENGALVGIDLPALHRRAEDSAANVLERVRQTLPTLPGTPPGGPAGARDRVVANLADLDEPTC